MIKMQSKLTVAASTLKDDVNHGSTTGGRNKIPQKSLALGGFVGKVNDIASNSDTPLHSYSGSRVQIPYPEGVGATPSSAGTPRRMFKWLFPPPSPEKSIMSAIQKRRETKKEKPPAIQEDDRKG
ncbi:unnamed protein product [Lactuca virosa]|uniref:Uncharacterized protein n=1 Tax=Lactuca virosa TaxID=75947 RepID=A0AAU9P6T1_9ASTR|nr:unnamed protein product [Lactuca virosa]